MEDMIKWDTSNNADEIQQKFKIYKNQEFKKLMELKPD